MSNLQPKTRQMPMRQRVKADFLQAHGLLTDKNLIWSQDFEGIRSDLARLIKQHADADSYPEALNDVVQTLIAEENDLTI